MARLTEDKRESIISDYHTNKYSQRQLAKNHNVSIGTINKLTKEIIPQNEHLVNAQTSLLVAKSEISNEQMNSIMNTAHDEARRLNLVYGASEKLLQSATNIISNNKVVEKINIGDGVQKFETRELNTSDVKNLAEAIDKSSITLGVNQRHAVNNIINTNNQQTNNNMKVSFE